MRAVDGQAAFVPFPRADVETSISARALAVARRHPERLAVRDADGDVSHATLAARAEAVAEAVHAAGAAADRPVATFFPQGAGFVAAMLGILRSGRAFVPLDPRHPPARSRFALEDADAGLVVTDPRLETAAREIVGRRPIVLAGPGPGAPMPTELSLPGPDAVACILYTSGSTGQPKGVVHDHRSLLHNTMRHVNGFRVTPDDHFSLFYPCSVYGGVRDVLTAMLSGASLHRYAVETQGVAGLPSWLQSEGITVYCSVATVFRQLLRAVRGERFERLRLMKLGGEAVFASDVEAWRRLFPRTCVLSCGLGATEVGAVRQVFIDHDTPLPGPRVPCGHPVEDVDVLIRSASGESLPHGETGEIVVRSRYIARGYWRRPEETATAFLPDPDGGDRRLYRTGDLGCLLPDGQLLHLGRADRQVKVHGHRVEPTEIEAVLLGLEDVEAAAVRAFPAAGADARLVAYVVIGRPEPPRAVETRLRGELACVLPAAMVPHRVVLLDELPLLAHGKVDREALPDPFDAGAPCAVGVGRPDSEATVRSLAAIWSELLGRADFGPDDRFADLGGDSLLLVQLSVLVEQRLGRRLPLLRLAEAPSLREMAAAIDGQIATGLERRVTSRHVGGVRVSLVSLQPRGSRPPLFFAAAAGGSVLPFHALALALGRDQPFLALQVVPESGRAARMALPELAAAAVELVLAARPDGSVHLGGWSFGGFLAFEIARQLRARGREVGCLTVVDSDATLVGARLSPALIARHAWRTLQMARHLRPLAKDAVHVRLATLLRPEAPARSPLALALARLAWRTGVRDAEVATYLAEDPDAAELVLPPRGVFRTMHAYIRAIRTYEPQPIDVPIDLLRPLDGESRREREAPSSLGWHALTTAGLRLHVVPGSHFDAFAARHAGVLAATIRRRREGEAEGS